MAPPPQSQILIKSFSYSPPVLTNKNHQIFGGQEVSNNLMELCRLFNIFTTHLTISQVYRRHTKKGAVAPLDHISTPSNGLLHPITATRHDKYIIPYFNNIRKELFCLHYKFAIANWIPASAGMTVRVMDATFSQLCLGK